MWRWIRHWRDWLMSEIVTPRRLAGQPQGLYFRFEKGGLTFDNQPVPWSADAVVVEALLRLPSTARKRNDFTLRIPGFEPIPTEIIKAEESGQRHRLFFRFPVPKATGTAELRWKSHYLGGLEIPVISPNQFLADLRLTSSTTFVNVEGRSVAAQTFVAKQVKGMTASAFVQSTTGLSPLLDLGLMATFRALRDNKAVESQEPLSASQLGGREALVTAIPPKLPRSQGEWAVSWTVASKKLASHQLQAITYRKFVQSLRVSDVRFGVLFHNGDFRVLRSLPADGVAQVGPCFFVASNEPGMAAIAQFNLIQQAPGVEPFLHKTSQSVLITDGPTPVVSELVSIEDLKRVSAFELQIANRTLGVLPLSPVPTATVTSEGGFKPPPEFTWTTTAEDELSERLARLMGVPKSER